MSHQELLSYRCEPQPTGEGNELYEHELSTVGLYSMLCKQKTRKEWHCLLLLPCFSCSLLAEPEQGFDGIEGVLIDERLVVVLQQGIELLLFPQDFKIRVGTDSLQEIKQDVCHYLGTIDSHVATELSLVTL